MKQVTRTGTLIAIGAMMLSLGACSRSAGDKNTAATERAELQAHDAMLRIDPRFVRAAADYTTQVERLRTTKLPPRQEQVGVTLAVNRLADAIELVPHAHGLSLDAAAEVVRNYAPTNVLGTSVPVASHDNVNALRAASAVLLGVANGPYAGAPDVKERATQFQRQVERIPTVREGDRRDATLAALQRADDTLRAIEIAIARGQVVATR